MQGGIQRILLHCLKIELPVALLLLLLHHRRRSSLDNGANSIAFGAIKLGGEHLFGKAE